MPWDDIDRRIIARVCGDLGEDLYPFRTLADALGITEDALLARLRAYRQSGAMRRFGAILRHQAAGYTANVLTVWNVPDERATEIGDFLAAHESISHCYIRPRFQDWPYNLYAMMHGHSDESCIQIAKQISQAIRIDHYQLLFSLREFKKSSRVYFADTVDDLHTRAIPAD